ncbi:MAG: ribosome maturation factor RimM [Dehalococcoidia bacterium]|nr:ribosome maturation factor RimM [Dehalococcoidia bacterium]
MSDTNPIKPAPAEPSDFITIGVILGAWGLKGAFKVRPTTDFPERFKQGAEVYLDKQALIIEKVIWQKGEVILKLPGIDTPEDAAKLSRKALEISSSALFELPEWQYYQFDIIGLEVRTKDGDVIGKVGQILNCGNDVYVVQNPGCKDVLIPATKDIIKSIDLKKGILVIEPIEGLLE